MTVLFTCFHEFEFTTMIFRKVYSIFSILLILHFPLLSLTVILNLFSRTKKVKYSRLYPSTFPIDIPYESIVKIICSIEWNLITMKSLKNSKTIFNCCFFTFTSPFIDKLTRSLTISIPLGFSTSF